MGFCEEMKLDDIKQDLEKGDFIYKGTCHDCQKEVSVSAYVTEDGAIHIEGGAVYKIKMSLGDRYFFKCDDCYSKDKTLRNYQNCEVYSRVVGYLRPVQQWNAGKLEEFEQRKLFKNTEEKK